MLSEEIIRRYIEMAKAGEKVENPKIELKREWWNLEVDRGQEEFIKDVTAMANTPGDDGHFIIGVDEESGELYNAQFPSEGKYDDPAKLGQLVHKKVQEGMNIETYAYMLDDKIIYVLEVPRSLNKPHIIKQHRNIQNFIPMRKSSGTRPADKFDLDLMYLERNSVVVPPYRLDLHLANPTSLRDNGFHERRRNLTCIVNILNTGTNINMVVSGELTLMKGSKEIATLNHANFFCRSQSERWISISENQYLQIPPNNIRLVNLGFSSEDESIVDYVKAVNEQEQLRGYITLTDVSDNTFTSKEIKFI